MLAALEASLQYCCILSLDDSVSVRDTISIHTFKRLQHQSTALLLAEPAMSVVNTLAQNDPARTRFSIRLQAEPSDAALAQALEQNPFITEIELNVDGEQRVDWNSLLRVIATRANLANVKLRDAPDSCGQKCTRRVGSLNLACDSAEHCHSKCGLAVGTSSHRHSYICGHRIFNHIVQYLWL